MQDYTQGHTMSIAIEADDFSVWRTQNGISPLDAPYRLYKRVGRQKEQHTFVPVGIQKSFFEDGMRRHFAVIYRDLESKQLETVRVASTFRDDSFPMKYTSVGESD